MSVQLVREYLKQFRKDGDILEFSDSSATVELAAALKVEFGFKAQMPGYDEVETLTGHQAGGVCPFGNPLGVNAYLDGCVQSHSRRWQIGGAMDLIKKR